MNKERRKASAKEALIIGALLVVIIALLLWIVSSKDKNSSNNSISVQSAQVQAPQQSQGQTKPSAGPVSPTAKDAADMYNNAVNALKTYSGAVSVSKTETVSIEVSNLPDAIASIVNGIISGLAGTKEETADFSGGISSEGIALTDSVIPKGINAAVDPAGLSDATVEDLSDGGKKITMTFLPETAFYDGEKNVSEPTYHRGAMDPIDFSTVNLGPIAVTGINIEYPGATVTAILDSQGRLTALYCNLPFGGDFNAKAMGAFDVALGMDCSMVTDWVITYN